MQPVVHGYLATKWVEGLFADARLSYVSHALEGLHRRCHGATPVGPAVLRSALEATRAEAAKIRSPRLRADALSRLGHAGEYSFVERLDILLRGLPEPTRRRICGSEEGEFLRRLKQSRNFLAHLMPELDNSVPEGFELMALCARAELFLYAALAMEVGFGDSAVNRAIECLEKRERTSGWLG